MTATPFNPALVSIERKRFSVTQGEVLISYDGTRIEQYGDAIKLVGKEYVGMSDEEWIAVAKREAIARGLATDPTPPADASLVFVKSGSANGYVVWQGVRAIGLVRKHEGWTVRGRPVSWEAFRKGVNLGRARTRQEAAELLRK